MLCEERFLVTLPCRRAVYFYDGQVPTTRTWLALSLSYLLVHWHGTSQVAIPLCFPQRSPKYGQLEG